MKKLTSDKDSEFSDEDLEAVAGGFNWDIILKYDHRIDSQLLS